MRNIYLHGELGSTLGKHWQLEVDSVQEALWAIEANTGKLTKFLNENQEKFGHYTFTVDQNADKKPGSAGKAGINQRIRVVEIGSKNPQKIVKKNIEGEIIASLKSEESFSGYLKRPDANKKSIIKNWYFTNDIGYIDNNGDLFVTGRVDDMIITGGENVSPIEIENLLSLNKNVLEVVVVGLPDEKWGQRICGFIKRDGNIEFGNLDKHCKESGMANFKRPKEYIFVKEIPKSPTGKILRRKLLAGEYDLDR